MKTYKIIISSVDCDNPSCKNPDCKGADLRMEGLDIADMIRLSDGPSDDMIENVAFAAWCVARKVVALLLGSSGMAKDGTTVHIDNGPEPH